MANCVTVPTSSKVCVEKLNQNLSIKIKRHLQLSRNHLDLELRWLRLFSLVVLSGGGLKVGALLFFASFFVSAFSATMAEGRPISDHMAWSFHLGEEFCAGWEGWLEGACSAQLRFDVPF